MTKTTKFIACLTAVLVLFSAACKRTDTNPQELRDTNTLTVESAYASMGTASISQELYAQLNEGKFITATIEGTHKYKAIGIYEPIDPGPVDPPYDPCAEDWRKFNAYMASVTPRMKAEANRTCQRQFGGWGGGECVACVLFYVDPDSPPCPMIAFEYQAELAIRESAGLAAVAEPTGTLTLSQSQSSALASGRYLNVNRVGEHEYLATGVVTPPVIGPIYPPYNPCAQDWADFNSYMNTYKSYWQSLANVNCNPVRGCWCGRCICIAFEIRPTSPPCYVINDQYQSQVRVHEGSVNAQ